MEPARRTAGAGHDVSAGSVAIGDGAAIGRVPRCMSAGSQKMRVAARHGHGIDAAAGFGGVVCQGGAVGREGRLGVVVAGAGEAHRAAAADGLHVEFEIAAGVAVGGVGDHSTVGGDGGPTSESGIESDLREEKIVGRRGLGETPERHRQNGKYDSGDDAPITHELLSACARLQELTITAATNCGAGFSLPQRGPRTSVRPCREILNQRHKAELLPRRAAGRAEARLKPAPQV